LSLLCFLVPLLSSIVLALPWKFSERTISYVTLTTMMASLFGVAFLFFMLVNQGFSPFEIHLPSITVSHHSFPLVFWIDLYGVGYLLMSILLGLIVVKFSHSYLHLEIGYQRYFSVILFFVFGLSLLSIAGHLDLFFAGWEIVGLSSFLLISFYRSHVRSVNNAWRVYCIYRICDIGLLSGAVLGHVMWKEATTFSVLNELSVHQVQEYHSVAFLIFCLCLVIASFGKSAQFPFYNWPAKAMEGPTPSSAIFYGALSIHAGLLLLIRTQVIWSSNFWATGLIVGAGGMTFILSLLQKKVQTNIKGRIAYGITSQIGLMYILLGLGLVEVVFIFMLLHAAFRCFQILISSSIVADSDLSNNKNVIAKIERRKTFMESLSMKLISTLYLFTSLDFGLNSFQWKWIVSRLKSLVGGKFTGWSLLIAMILFLFIPLSDNYYYISGASVLLAIRGLFYHRSPLHMIIDVIICLAGVLTSFALIDHHALKVITDYLYPIFPALLAVLSIAYCFREKDIRHFHGEGRIHTIKANIFLIAFMVISGMPVSSAFIAEDIILESLIEHRPVLAVLTLFILMLVGIILSKVYVRLFMGRAPMLT